MFAKLLRLLGFKIGHIWKQVKLPKLNPQTNSNFNSDDKNTKPFWNQRATFSSWQHSRECIPVMGSARNKSGRTGDVTLSLCKRLQSTHSKTRGLYKHTYLCSPRQARSIITVSRTHSSKAKALNEVMVCGRSYNPGESDEGQIERPEIPHLYSRLQNYLSWSTGIFIHSFKIFKTFWGYSEKLVKVIKRYTLTP